ncbi:MAG: hypothetical protein JWM19_1335 [Actinomycetia bacterium]|nr:hypothetical protein [Actinomycetes bacterium]
MTLARLRRALHAAGLTLSACRRYATMLLREALTGGDVRFTDGRQVPLDYRNGAEYASFRKDYALAPGAPAL